MGRFKPAQMLEAGLFGLILWLAGVTFLPVSSIALNNADNAIHQLMVRDFHWLTDLYYWGQNRIGSLEPLLAQPFRFVLGSDGALSLVHMACMVTGYCCFARWIQQPLVRLALALAWLMPMFVFNFAALAHPYAAQFACVGLGLWLLDRSPTHPWNRFGGGLCLGLSVWVSDASIVHLFALYGLRRPLQLRRHWRWFSLGLSLPVGLVILAKTMSPGVANYGGIARPWESWDYLQRVGQAIWQAGQTNPLVPSLIGYGASIGVLYGYAHFRGDGRWRGHGQRIALSFPWIFRYGLYALGWNIGLILISKWVMMNSVNGLPNQYFAPIYGWVAVLLALLVDRLRGVAPRSWRRPVLATSFAAGFFTLTLVGAIQTRLAVNGFIQIADQGLIQNPAGVSRTPALMAAVRAMPPAGVIGDYWTAYLWCGIDDRFICTAHDKSYVRQKRLIPVLQQQPLVYLIQNRWLTAFPDEMTQFDRRLRRIGPPQAVHTYTVAPYIWVP